MYQWRIINRIRVTTPYLEAVPVVFIITGGIAGIGTIKNIMNRYI